MPATVSRTPHFNGDDLLHHADDPMRRPGDMRLLECQGLLLYYARCMDEAGMGYPAWARRITPFCDLVRNFDRVVQMCDSLGVEVRVFLQAQVTQAKQIKMPCVHPSYLMDKQAMERFHWAVQNSKLQRHLESIPPVEPQLVSEDEVRQLTAFRMTLDMAISLYALRGWTAPPGLPLEGRMGRVIQETLSSNRPPAVFRRLSKSWRVVAGRLGAPVEYARGVSENPMVLETFVKHFGEEDLVSSVAT